MILAPGKLDHLVNKTILFELYKYKFNTINSLDYFNIINSIMRFSVRLNHLLLIIGSSLLTDNNWNQAQLIYPVNISIL